MKVILGGSFDPVHIGHLRLATELAEQLMCKVDLMPCSQAVHKAPQAATKKQRLDMLKLSVQGNPLLGIDERELHRESESYTITSLRELRDELGPNASLVFVMGEDSAKSFSTWKEVSEYGKLANILILTRPNSQTADSQMLDKASFKGLGYTEAQNLGQLTSQPSGLFYTLTLSELDISSSYIRRCVQQKHSIRYIVTDAVQHYICDNALYT